ncbi:IBR domain protein [Rhizoctonia solani AG-3 Rhs1AP]|uniref:RBR-type E3 ubiquitin transferase n=1 Tax=Rhizoctonia solani AG-3 Rhs1AP TaxID=1086054 RepID=X8JUS1_9AGAM|nr:IBR domain protein [Rhizoctonia solani AG-3 Rhs1AP]
MVQRAITPPIVQDIDLSTQTEGEPYRWFPSVETLPVSSRYEVPTAPSSPAEPRCMVCFETKPLTTIGTSNCSHDSRVLSYEDILAGVNDEEVVARYERLLLRRALDQLPNFVWCKNPQCSSGQFHDNDPTSCPNVKCDACGHESCFVHDTPWHQGLTCSQYDSKMKRSAQTGKIRANEAYISKHAKACPNPGCGRVIEKGYGCDHMTCMGPMGCGHEFCWCCLADYKPIHEQGNHLHKRRCRHHDSRFKLAMKRALVWILRL